MGDYGNDNTHIKAESETNEPIDKLRADIAQNINGYLIEVITIADANEVTIDGKVFNGTFSDALKHCGRLPVRWDSLFD